ncbi:hypothetical protein [Glycomyces sp. MUSA5-2]|uniref:hypothetical protein n=1 Tax=Glycomyces sp. MUSA5-2 TaxID=2053002 RepID=UPI00300AE468
MQQPPGRPPGTPPSYTPGAAPAPGAPRGWEPGSARRIRLAAGTVALILAGLAVYALLRPGLGYEFAAPDDWAEHCLGTDDAAVQYLDWADAAPPRPSASTTGSSSTYRCDWYWRPAGTATTDQQLTIAIDVHDTHHYQAEDRSDTRDDSTMDWPQSATRWSADTRELPGWEHGSCWTLTINGTDTMFECVASDSNLRLTVTSTPLDLADPASPKVFGPGAVAVDDLTVELGTLIRTAFAK